MFRTKKERQKIMPPKNLPIAHSEKELVNHLLWQCLNMPVREDEPQTWFKTFGFIQATAFMLNIITLKDVTMMQAKEQAKSFSMLSMAIKCHACTLHDIKGPYAYNEADKYAERIF